MTDCTPRRVTHLESVDHEAEVVIVGLGAAGASAALEARTAGASTLVLEGAGGGGGTSAMSGGLIYLGGGTAVQEACGVDDTPEEMFKFLMAACGPEADEDKVRLYCDTSVDHFNWLVQQGVPFKSEFYDEPGMEPPTDAGLVYTGGEDAWPYDQIAKPAPRGHKPRTPHAAGGFLMERLLEAVEQSGARIEYDIVAERLLVDDDDRVIGLECRRAGGAETVRATRGVILCAGGFIMNDEMLDQHAPALRRCELRLGTDLDQGWGIKMSQAMGAAVRRMDAAEVAVPITPPRPLVGGILVNDHGQRFINEDTYFGHVGQEALHGQDGHIYLIVDDELYQPTRIGHQASWVSESVDELEGEMGLPSGSLQATLDLYNRHAADGKDPVFHKSPDFVRPLDPPLGAFDFTVENSIYATFTLGGLATKPTGEVLSIAGNPIPGLYAAGRTTAGIAAGGYVSGISLGDGTFFGRMAAHSAAHNS